ncbi:MAG: hypothetical protein IT305_30145 [Chloroflexi bacterium]|nr:hypothetical protein [Chloroflexota bacterium]
MRRFIVLVGFLFLAVATAIVPASQPAEAQNCFGTGFCIQNPAFLEYYQSRGQERTLGFPISNEFTLDGFQVQFFQRVVLQMNQGTVARLNVLDPDIMPLTRANGSIFPPSDPSLAAAAPQVGSPSYAQDVVNFVRQVAPNQFNGQPVNFFQTFMTTVPPQPGADANIMTLLNLEIWGLPTSNPAADPNNGGFIYQRFQRGIMHYRAVCTCTEGILIGEYFKAVLTGVNLPPDLAEDMQNSRYFRQYDPSAPNAVARPNQLPNTNMSGAFGNITPPPPPVNPPSGATATSTPSTTTASGPSVTIQLSDSRIDPGQQVDITVIASDPAKLTWIEWEGIPSSRRNENDNEDRTDDPQLDRQRFDCDRRTQCANVWSVKPTVPGDYVIRARARDENGVRSDWTSVDFRVRQSQTTATPTGTTAATATSTTAPATATPTATLTPTP